MNKIIICVISLIMISQNLNYEKIYINKIPDTEKSQVDSILEMTDFPLNTVISGDMGKLTISDYKEYYDMDYEHFPQYGLSYIKPDNTLWSYIEDSYLEKEKILYKKQGDNIISVNQNNDRIVKLKKDGSLWINKKVTQVDTIIDEYGFSKIAENVHILIPDSTYNKIYILKKDCTIWKITLEYKNFNNIEKIILRETKIMDNILYMAISYNSNMSYSLIIKADKSLWKCENEDFNKLKKITNNVIYVDIASDIGIILKTDKSLFFLSEDESLTKIDDNIEYAKFGSRICGLKSDGSLWTYFYKTEEKSNISIYLYSYYDGTKEKKADNIECILNGILVKSKDNKIMRFSYGTNIEEISLEILEDYDIKTPELYDITKPFK